MTQPQASGRKSSGAVLGLIILVIAITGYSLPAVAQRGITPPQKVVTLGGALPTPLPLFPATNWWNLDISSAPVAVNSANFITFINNGGNRRMHPDFGGVDSENLPDGIYGFPYIVVDGSQTKVTVHFVDSDGEGNGAGDESDGVDHNTNMSFPFYPIPDSAKTQPHWVEQGQPGNQDLREEADRHILIVDRDNKYLYELYNVFWDGTNWNAYSGARFDMKTNDRRPEEWTSADAAGLAILPGLVRYDEVYGSGEINHAFRVTMRDSNGYVFPASHVAGDEPQALPMGARLRMKAATNISTYPAEMQKIFRAMKKYGLIMADNGSDMFVSGTFDTRWDSDVTNTAFHALHANDFEVIQLGYNPPPVLPTLSVNDVAVTEGNAGTVTAAFTVTLSASSTSDVTVNYATANGTTNPATQPADYVASSGTVTFFAGQTTKTINVTVNGDTLDEPNETFFVNLSSPSGATIADAQGLGTITDDDPTPTLSINDVGITEGNSGTAPANFTVTLSAASGRTVTVNYATGNQTALAGFDYVATSGTLTFSPGVTTRPIAVSVIGDAGVESTETFAVNLSSPTNATISDAQGIGTITDNDVGASRTFASASGNDASDCSVITTPCRSIGVAIVQAAVNGEVIVLSPGEYESAPLTISKGVKVTSPSGTVAFVRQPITINAPAGRVVLRGLTIKGAGAGDGVTVTAADFVSIEESTIDRWANGVKLGTASGTVVSITNTALIANTIGLQLGAGGSNKVTVESSRFESNGTGLSALSGSFVVHESSFLSNSTAGVSVNNGSVDIQRSEISLNGTGVKALAAGTVRISRSRVFGNTVGLDATAGSTFLSSGTNTVGRNGTNTSGTIGATPEG